MKNYANELIKKLKQEEEMSRKQSFYRGGRGKQQRVGFQFAKDLPLYEKKTSIIVELAAMLYKNSVSRNVPQLGKEIDFLIGVLKDTKSFWLQQIKDFQLLLNKIEEIAVINKGLPSQNSLVLSRYSKKCELSVPLQQLKAFWQKCLACGNLHFQQKESGECICDSCEEAIFMSPPIFQEQDSSVQYDKKGRVKIVDKEVSKKK